MKVLRLAPKSLPVVATFVVVLLLSLSGAQSLGVTLISDDFSDGDRFKTGAADADWLHYNMTGGSGPSSGYLSVVPDATAQIGSGNALEHGPVDRAAVAMFSATTLSADGDSISLSFDFRIESGFSYCCGFRYALFNNDANPQTDSGNESDSGIGYGGFFGTHTASSVSTTLGGPNVFTSSGVGGIGVTPLDVADGSVHQFEMELTKSGDNLAVVLTMDSVEIGNDVAATATFTFNSVGLYNADAWQSPPATMYFDNIVVETSVTPPVPGDVDGDGLVNSVDFGIIRQNFWQSFTDRADGDLVDNDFIDFADYAQWKQAPKDPDPASSAELGTVPEPNSFFLLMSGIAAVCLLRRTALRTHLYLAFYGRGISP